MNWLTASAIVIVLLFVANGIAYRLRFGTFLRQEERGEFSPRSRLTKAGVAVYTVFTAALVLGFGAREATPESPLGAMLQSWFTFAAYIVWCLFGATILGVALTLCGYPSYQKSNTEDR